MSVISEKLATAKDKHPVLAQNAYLSYETVLFLFSLFSVWFALQELGDMPIKEEERVAEQIVYFVFVIDYFAFFFLAKDKKAYVKSHVFELLAILPVYYCFTWLRSLRILRFVRIFVLVARVGRLISDSRGLMNHNGFKYVLLTCAGLWFLGAIGYCYFEADFEAFSDALWWSIVTMSTVGYGDISPATLGGRMIAGVLMLFGVSFIGILSSTITSYLIEKKTERESPLKEELLHTVLTRLETPEKLSDEELALAFSLISRTREENLKELSGQGQQSA